MGPGNRARALAVLAAIFIAAGQTSHAQSTLPPTAPTALAPSTPGSDTPAPAAPVHRAQVSYQLGQLTVIAENSSLEEILRDIAASTGMKITGGVVDQQVYGTYGPASVSSVLRRLLDGSGSNMILRETAKGEPAELVLTAAQGAPTPPDLASASAGNLSPTPMQPPTPPPYNGTAPQPPGAPPRPVYQSPQPVITQSVAQPQAATQQTTPASTNDTTPRSPNGVLTPQQIYEQLQRLQQQPQRPVGSR